jgi:hypothetical protein
VEGVDWINVAEYTESSTLLWTRKWTFGFHTMQGISWLAEKQLASKDGPPSMDPVIIHTNLQG